MAVVSSSGSADLGGMVLQPFAWLVLVIGAAAVIWFTAREDDR